MVMQYCYAAASSLDVDSKLAINAKLKSKPVSFLLLFQRTGTLTYNIMTEILSSYIPFNQ